VLIMDEVDGMSGNADRAGMAELIQMIKRSKVPIICICNDRQSIKIRSLANHCFDLRFQRPRVEQIKGCLLSIAAREKANISKEAIDKLIEASNQDIRQSINTLQLMAGSTSSNKQFNKKDISFNIFDVARQILSTDTKILQKQELFFQDYSIIPLFVQENYPNVRCSRMGNHQHVHAIRLASESIVFGDILDKLIRSSGQWSLLVHEAMFSCALPALYMDGHLTNQVQFPTWFGRNSNRQKRHRLMRQIGLHTHLKTSGSSNALVVDYLGLLRDKMYRPLIDDGVDGVREVVKLYLHYNLLRDDADAINELGVWPTAAGISKKDLASLVPAKTKSALTRALNKEQRRLPYEQSLTLTKGGRKKATTNDSNEEDEKDNLIIPEEEEDESPEIEFYV